MTSAVVPIRDIRKTFPEAGRIRLGIKAKTKGGKEYPKAIDTFRLTSQYRAPLEQAAELWGGEVGPWNDQWEVVTETNTMDIVLPLGEGFDPLGGTPVYELWSAGGCTRRCDGETVVTPQQTSADTVEMTESPCICSAKGILECSVKLRLTVGLPDLDFYGFWRLETGSMYAVRENQGMLELIASLQAHGIHRGVLTLERREIKKPGATTRKFVVPIVRLAGSMNELQAGTVSDNALGTAPERPSLTTSSEPTQGGSEDGAPESRPVSPPASSGSGAPPTSEPGGGDGEAPPPGEEDIVDAEIVEEDEPALPIADQAKLRATFMAIVKGENCKLDYDSEVRPFLQAHYDGRSWSDLTAGEKQALVNTVTRGKNAAEKAAAQKEFAKKVRKWHEAVTV